MTFQSTAAIFCVMPLVDRFDAGRGLSETDHNQCQYCKDSLPGKERARKLLLRRGVYVQNLERERYFYRVREFQCERDYRRIGCYFIVKCLRLRFLSFERINWFDLVVNRTCESSSVILVLIDLTESGNAALCKQKTASGIWLVYDRWYIPVSIHVFFFFCFRIPIRSILSSLCCSHYCCLAAAVNLVVSVS